MKVWFIGVAISLLLHFGHTLVTAQNTEVLYTVEQVRKGSSYSVRIRFFQNSGFTPEQVELITIALKRMKKYHFSISEISREGVITLQFFQNFHKVQATIKMVAATAGQAVSPGAVTKEVKHKLIQPASNLGRFFVDN